MTFETAKRWAGPHATVVARCLLRGYPVPRWGNLRRTAPFSANYGFERGTPIDRHYLDAFLSAHRDQITGDVLEVQTSSYTERLGCGVRRSDHGNCLAAIAAQLGLADEELSPPELDVHDAGYPVLNTIAARLPE